MCNHYHWPCRRPPLGLMAMISLLCLQGFACLQLRAQTGNCARIDRFETVSGGDRFCVGQSVALRAEVQTSPGAVLLYYEWLRNGTTVATTQLNTYRLNSLTEADEGEWAVEITVICRDFATLTLRSDPFSINVTPSPDATIAASPGTVLNCEQSSLTLRVPGAPANATFAWQGPGLSANTRQVQVNRGGTFLVEVSANGCSEQDFITLTDNQSYVPTAAAGPDIILQRCDQAITLDASASTNGGRGNLQYQWTGPGFNYTGGNARVTVNNAQPGTYRLLVRNTLSLCTDTDEVALDGSLLELPVADAGDPRTITCRNEAVDLGGSATSEGPGLSYQWQPLDGGNIVEGQNTATARVDEPGRYRLTVRNTSTRCTGRDEVTVAEDREAPTVSIRPGQDIFFCSGGNVTLQAVGDADTWSWSTGTEGPSLTVDSPGIVFLEGTLARNGCSGTAEVMVEERQRPSLDDTDSLITLAAGATLLFTLNPNPPNAKVHWEVEQFANIDEGRSSFASGGQGSLTGRFFPRSSRAPGGIDYLAYARSDGCRSDSSRIRVRVLPESSQLFIPEVFTPNGDGVNDEWIILVPEGDSPDAYSITLYDRRGRPIFKRNTLSQPWDGGNLPDGIYYYTIVRELDGFSTRGAVAIVK